MKKHNKIFIYSIVMATGLFWGVSFLITAILLSNGADPIQIQACRWLIAGSCYALLLLTGKLRIDIHKPEFKYLIAAGICQPCVYMIFENYGIKFSNSSMGSIFIATIPCFALLINTVVFKHHTSKRGIASILIAFTGVAICTVFAPGFSMDGNVKGYALLMGAVLSGAIYTVVSARAGRSYAALEITATMSFIGFLFFTTLNITMGYGMGTYTLLFGSAKLAAGTIFLGFCCSALCYLFLNNVIILMDDPALGNNLTSSTTTIIGALAGIIVAGDPAGIYTVVGLTLTVGGVILASREV